MYKEFNTSSKLLVFLLGLLLVFISALMTNFQILLVSQNYESFKWSTPNLPSYMLCRSSVNAMDTSFSGTYTLCYSRNIFFISLKLLLPWCSLWKLIGVLPLPYTNHWACHLTPSVYWKPVQIYLSTVNLASPPNSERVFCTRHSVTNRNEMWRRQFSLSSCSDRALCLVSLWHWVMPLYQQPATQEILE